MELRCLTLIPRNRNESTHPVTIKLELVNFFFQFCHNEIFTHTIEIVETLFTFFFRLLIMKPFNAGMTFFYDNHTKSTRRQNETEELENSKIEKRI